MKKRLSDRKGSTIVEAAVVFPLVILTVTAVIYILAFMYDEAAAQVEMHLALNAHMGRETRTVITYSNVPENANIYEGKKDIEKCYFAENGLRFGKKGLLRHSFMKRLESRIYSVDEKKHIRYSDFFR